MTEAVLDASAVLAMLDQEPGGEVTREWLRRGPCAMSAVNLSEVIAKLQERGGANASIARVIERLALEVVPFGANEAMSAGLRRSTTRRLGLSFGDRACVDLAEHRGLPLLTAERTWAGLNLSIDVIVTRPAK